MVSTIIISLLVAAILIFIQQILFTIGKGLCWVIGFLTDVFEMVAGLDTVIYTGNGSAERKLLIKVFFGNTTINTIYWGMALIGIVMCIGFTIVAVIKKSGDSGDRVKQSMGDILKNCFKGITIILLMNFVLSATISLTSTLMDRINYLMLNAQNFDMSYDVTFDSDDYACMARSLNTIGNYSLNASYNSRYNLNSCYNDVRTDLKKLADKGKFDVTYITTAYDEDGNSYEVATWQSVLQKVYRSVDDISSPQPLDTYNSKLSEALLEAMDTIKNDASFEALEKYHVVQKNSGVGEMIDLDRMIMLIGSMYGKGANLSKGSGMTDYYRAPYFYGQKDVFNYGTVSDDFDMTLGTWLYLTVIITAIFFAKEMLAMVFNAAARIFNMLLLYISAPPFIAVTPLDDGGKLKQWTTAFIIQSLGLFGTVISLRLVMIVIPMLFSGDIQFFEGARADTFARIIIMYAAMLTARKASGMIVGILADNAGMQAIQAGDIGGEARNAVSSGWGYAKKIGGFAMGLAGKGLGKLDELAKGSKGATPGGGGGGGASKLAMGAKKPAAQGQPKPTAAQPKPKTPVKSVGANGKGDTGNGGSFETGNSGSARDYESANSHPTLEPVETPQQNYNSDFTPSRKMGLSLDDDEPQEKPNKQIPDSAK